jgi:DNA-binding GntR family transcriptional regulator
MSDRTLRNFFQVAPMIYEAICRLAVQNHNPSQLEDLKRTQERFRRASVNGEASAMVLENNRFHEIMGEMAGSTYLEPSLGRLLIDHARIGQTFSRPHSEESQKRLELSLKHHDEFIEAIGDHDERRAVDLMKAHWELSRADMQRFIAPDGLHAQNLTGDSYL